ncbi:MAG: hypothetical protein M3R06_10710 [Chloroflexota bacterium]|nr:hypothetical protein [Chloroflexota bacterium]
MSKKKWKIEQYTAEILPSVMQSLVDYGNLPLRESVILTSAIFDTALAELIQRRLTGPTSEIIEFLGADEDGRAPCGSFGSRIQMARLLGILVDEDVELLRRLKKLRNIAAHRVKLAVSEQKVGDALVSIWELLRRPIGVVVSMVTGAYEGDPRVVEWLKLQHSEQDIHSTLKQLKDTVEELKQKQSWMFTLGVEPKLLPFAFTTLWFPKMLRENPVAGSIMMALLIGLYKGRLDLLFEVVVPVTTLELPTRAIQMWDSDRIAGNATAKGT